MEGPEDCSVKVAVHIRPLIGDECSQGCQDCVAVVPGKPQVQVSSHSFTFDHVYGNKGSPSSVMFEECVAPLVDGLFQGYNATVLAYGQTGSGKTYTMGTGFKDGSDTGLIPQVMNSLFSKIETSKHEIEFQLHVSFIEILKEEVRDLLDNSPVKQPIQIRETSTGVITLAGSTEVGVRTLKEMAACLEQGSLNRATGSTNMNNQSSRSHAIFTITLEQMRRPDSSAKEYMNGEFLCAKLHLVDLAGSERAKRTGSDGVRFKEGVHINRGLLALGNVISALGDEKKRKDGAHVPYRDSKLTRLLQDSLGGNSRTVMIACISPADINVEETLNTLKYANRARNIKNKPIVNRDSISNEMQKMRQQLEYLQAELLYAQKGGPSLNEMQDLKERITCLEATNEDLSRELHEHRKTCSALEKSENKSEEGANYPMKSEGLKRGLQKIDSFDYQMGDTLTCMNSKEADEEVAKELEHSLLQKDMEKELNELNKRLEQKESETVAEPATSMDVQEEIQSIKAQKVQLQHKIKQEAEQFRQWKAAREKELLQLRKEGRRNENERHKLQALNQRQKMVLQRKMEEAAIATKRLKGLLEARTPSMRDTTVSANGNAPFSQWLNHELEVTVNVHEVRVEYERQSQVRATFAEELAILKEVDDLASRGLSPPHGKRYSRLASISPNARTARIESLENMLSISSNTLVAMAAQLSAAEERDRALNSRGRWNQIRTMADAKNLLQHMFNAAADARCLLWEKEDDIKEMKEQLNELVGLLGQSEARRKATEKQQKLREQTVAIACASSPSLNGNAKNFADGMSCQFSPMSLPAQKQLKSTAGTADGTLTQSGALLDHQRKMMQAGHSSTGKKPSLAGQAGRWKRSHHQWLVQFKWKWQKPWRLSEWIRHSDETIVFGQHRPWQNISSTVQMEVIEAIDTPRMVQEQ
ncbi:hypothetical protein MKW98_015248 [Papaver atlanticum]|uniref:Kinesin-like protein n=1 Tax=Papaver atlanticum TaxID=357466 RepID=A0AAD4T361_9MAGN|nr:hypothetical protein MKW98_015248 [Papaver atlanticum]